MSMRASDALPTLAEIAIGLADFSGIVAAFSGTLSFAGCGNADE